MTGQVFLSMMLVYLLFHLFVSERSVPSLLQSSMQQKSLHADISRLQAEREELFAKVSRLRPQSLDVDLVDEYSIHMLGKRAGDSVIIIDGATS